VSLRSTNGPRDLADRAGGPRGRVDLRPALGEPVDVADDPICRGAHAGPTLERSRFHDGDPHNAIVARRGVSPPLVALSFDDGPVPGATRRILASLRCERAHATFFEIGRRAQRHPEIVRAQLAAGHEVASHTWSHRRLVPLTRGALLAEIVDGAMPCNV